MAAASVADLDPIKYEIFAHRLWEIGEEGRIALVTIAAAHGAIRTALYRAV